MMVKQKRIGYIHKSKQEGLSGLLKSWLPCQHIHLFLSDQASTH